jgi:hypothetical protein
MYTWPSLPPVLFILHPRLERLDSDSGFSHAPPPLCLNCRSCKFEFDQSASPCMFRTTHKTREPCLSYCVHETLRPVSGPAQVTQSHRTSKILGPQNPNTRPLFLRPFFYKTARLLSLSLNYRHRPTKRNESIREKNYASIKAQLTHYLSRV